MTKPSQTPPSPLFGAHLLEGLLSKERRKLAIELAFLGRLVHGTPVREAAFKEAKVRSTETRDIEDELARDFAGFQNPFFAVLAGALERLQGGDVGFGRFTEAKEPQAQDANQSPHPSPFIEDMIRRGDLLDSATFAAKLNWTQQMLTKESSANRVFFIELASPRYFPAFYADGKYDQRHLAR